MLYKNNKEKLDMKLFENPTSEYRAAPFWSWNCELEEDELLWQIEQLKQMGFGGFHMHTRSGMATKYLSDEFMNLVKKCTQKAQEEQMLAYLYDEDRWPSGAAGGYVTKYPEFRQRRLCFTLDKMTSEPRETAVQNGTTYLVGIYDIYLNEKGELTKYKLIGSETEAKGIVRYAYVQVYSSFTKSPGWYNGYTYVDTLSKQAIEKFVEITHERYKAATEEYFGETVPAIFTDEPQFSRYFNLPTPDSNEDAFAPWTPDIEETFFNKYDYNIAEKIPELFWELENGRISKFRYDFHDHVCQLFADAFSGTCGKWCEENGISLTGHLFGEYTLLGQLKGSGEAMRSYHNFQLPGVDVLMDSREYTTVKQVQSAVRQYGREGGMSELYGVTNWDFDFRGHKKQGDWQAAMGITLRVPHLAWVSMKGAAKRDYPASINYQSPWYKEYPCIENHFARLNTVLTRGIPVVNVGVIHPIESYWINYGPESVTSSVRKELEEKFDNITKWLLFDNIDFDFICESTLPELCGNIGKRLSVGKMSYSVIIVPACVTLRKTTVDVLNKFISAGGRVIFAGEAPKYINALPDEEIVSLYERAQHVPFEKHRIVSVLETERSINITDASGGVCNQFIYQMRKDNYNHYLFIANANPTHNNIHSYGNDAPKITSIQIRGEYRVSVLDTLSGVEKPISYIADGGYTKVNYSFHENDSLLLKLIPGKGNFISKDNVKTEEERIDFKHRINFKRHEDNVCLLDLAEYALDGGEFQETEEILRIDKKLREKFSWPLATGQDMQPWAIEKEDFTHTVTLRFTFTSEEILEKTYFCAEEIISLLVNGDNVALRDCGYFVDKSIRKYALPPLKKGENTIIIKVPFEKQTSLEACYLTGDFDVLLTGCEKTLTKAKSTVGFGDLSTQGMPFYGGNITYSERISVTKDCDLCINIAKYKGALTKVIFDGRDMGNIIFAPYELYIEGVSPGEHMIEFVLYGNRHNTFGGLHNCGRSIYYGQGYWYAVDDSWSYEYNLKKYGILKSPVIKVL